MTDWLAIVRRGAGLLALAFLIDFTFVFVFLIVLQTYLPESFGASASIAAFALGAFGAAKLVSQFIGGVLSDVLGARRMLASGLLLKLAATVAMVPCVHTAPWLVLGVSVIYGLGSSLCWPPIYSFMTAAFQERERARIGSALTIATTLALALGVAVGTILNVFVSFDAAMAVAISAAFIGVVVLLRLPPSHVSAPTTQEPKAGSFDALSLVITSPPRLVFSLLVLGESAALGAVAAVYRAYGREVLHVSLTHQALLLMPAAAVGMLSVPLGGTAGDRYDRRALLVGGFAVAAACFLLLSVWHATPAVVVAAMVAAIAFGLAVPSVGASMMHLAGPAASRGAVIGWFLTAEGVGQFVGPTLAGAVLAWHGAAAVLVLVSAVFLAVACAAACLPASREGIAFNVPDEPATR
jgi:MFS family permease